MDGGTASSNARLKTATESVRDPAQRYLGNHEPSLNELLTDPIAALLRRSDRLSLEEVCRCIADVMARRRYRSLG